MSERRRLESTIRNASFELEAAISELDDAVQFLDGHGFLIEANPMLRDDLRYYRATVDVIRERLWNWEVQS